MKIEHKHEYAIPERTHKKIGELFQTCFEGYPQENSFYRQVPTFRYLAWEDKNLVGHLAVDYRIVNLTGRTVRIFGIVDLCVRPEYQSKRIASDLLDRVEETARKAKIDFIILFAAKPDVYKKNGFAPAQNRCRWVLLGGNETIGVVERRLDETLMVKSMNEISWTEGLLDLLGTAF